MIISVSCYKKIFLHNKNPASRDFYYVKILIYISINSKANKFIKKLNLITNKYFLKISHFFINVL